jgi:hypothetical protein
VIVGIDRSASTDAGVEHVEENKPVDRHPPPPPDSPGQEPEGVPSRLEARRALATAQEQAAGNPAEATDQKVPKSASEQGLVVAETKPESAAASQSAEMSETAGQDRSSAGRYDAGRDQPGILAQDHEDTAVGAAPTREVVGADVEGDAGEGDRQTAPTQDAAVAEHPLERTDQPHEVKPPQIVRDYYTNIPPTAQDRYLVRDQSNPVPVFDGSPTRDQVVQNNVGDCGIVAAIGSVAEHRPDAIKNAVKQAGDGEYEITLHEITEATPADPVARPTGDVKTYRVNDELPVNTDDPTRPPAGIQAESCGWPALMEKVIAAEDQTWETAKKADWDQAWTRHKPAVDQDRANVGLRPSPNDAPTGYNRLDIGSTPYQQADLLAKLTGEDAEVRRIPGEEMGEQALLDGFRDQLGAGKPVLVGTRGLHITNEQFPEGIYAGHAYEVTKVEKDKIYTRNPWGYDHPDPMNTKTFWEYYRRYNHDGTRDGHYTTLK